MVLHDGSSFETVEEKRLEEDRLHKKYWKRWGPYLSERQWGTVREDYSGNGDAWSSFTYDEARARAYRWGEDGIGGISDTHQHMCLSFAFWNEKDPYLKERYFGLSGHEGNHGEDVKEVYYYLDCTPSHAYMKMLYKYPQCEFPYEKLRKGNAQRSRDDSEYEITDMDVFAENRYWDIFIEYGKDAENEEEMYIRISAYNRGPEPASLHIVPQLFFRNDWVWGWSDKPKPNIDVATGGGANTLHANHWKLKDRYLYCPAAPSPDGSEGDVEPQLLFTDNETNKFELYGQKGESKYCRDAFHRHIVDEDTGTTVNPEKQGTKSAAWYNFQNVPPQECAVVRLKFTNTFTQEDLDDEVVDGVIEERNIDADEFYANLSPNPMSDDLRSVQRQAFSGMLWNKQFYYFIYSQWAAGDPTQPPPPPERKNVRNQAWKHLYIDDILSMPDKWEYPYFCVWDTAFHCIPLAMLDPEFAKKQLDRMTREWYLHPNGQVPAYEWNFSDVNPPVHAWATFRVFKIERKLYGKEDLDFLERVFQKLLLNFTWWVNRKDENGRNIFEGGFLGLDNIGLFNRSEPLPTGGTLVQADATSWMAFYCLNMLNIALELSKHRGVYEDIASKFFEHFLLIADAMVWKKTGDDEELSLWNDEDGFYYDAISWGGPYSQQLAVRSLVGLIPLYAVLTIEPEVLSKNKSFHKRVKWLVENRKDFADRNIASIKSRGSGHRLLLALVNKERLVRTLERMLDENEFLSEYGIRSMSKYHEKNPVTMFVNGDKYSVEYVPGDSRSGMFGGNSNWRGPIWLATNFLLIESLQRFYMYYGDSLKVECPKGSGVMMHLGKVAEMIQHRLQHIFAIGDDGCRPCNGGNEMLNQDPNFQPYVTFNEFFHADSGRGLGASHQLGWTGLVAKLIHDTGINVGLPKTPGTPSTAASHYFDEVFTKISHRHRRRGTGRSIGSMSGGEDDDTLSLKTEEDDRDHDSIISSVARRLQRMRSSEYAGPGLDELCHDLEGGIDQK